MPRLHRFPSIAMTLLGAILAGAAEPPPVAGGLAVDLAADRGLTLEDGDRVAAWESTVPGVPSRRFAKQEKGRSEPGSGRPTLHSQVPELGGRPSLVFRQQELLCADPDAFDHLTAGTGCTWFAVIALLPQRIGLKDVNSFFGNLRNGGKYEGLWGCVDDDGRVWWGPRNGRTFGRFDANNPKVAGPVLGVGTWHVVAGRLGAGTGTVPVELFVDSASAVSRGEFPVDPGANPGPLAIGQERDAVNHPGLESFDGEISRFLLYDRPLDDAELAQVIARLHP